MPYKDIEDLPEPVQNHLPKEAQKIYLEAFNNAWEQYASKSKRRGSATREVTAHKVAWNAVKKKYRKGENGHWVKAA